MEFTNDIYFNNNLTKGKIATITYSGTLFKSGSEYVNLVSGFGDNWDYTTTLPMTKTENGFTAEIEMKDYENFNFCFSNEYNNWDNNNGYNYISPILLNVIEENENGEQNIDFGTDYSNSIDNIIEDILGNTVQNDLSNNESDSIDKILESVQEETLPEIEDLFTELFSEEFGNINEDNEGIKLEEPSSKDINAELIKIFDELFSENSETVSETVNTISSENTEISTGTSLEQNFDLDGLISDLLEPVVASTPNIETEADTALTVVESNDLLVSSRKLGFFYKLKKRIRLACYKLFVKMPQEFLKQFN